MQGCAGTPAKSGDPAHGGCYQEDVDAMQWLPGEKLKRPWPPFIKMAAAVKAKVENPPNPQQQT